MELALLITSFIPLIVKGVWQYKEDIKHFKNLN